MGLKYPEIRERQSAATILKMEEAKNGSKKWLLMFMTILGAERSEVDCEVDNAFKYVRGHFARPRTNGFGLVCPVS